MTKKEDILTVLHGTPSATAEEVTGRTGFAKDTVRVSLSRLESEDKVARTPDGRWHVK